MSPIGFCEGAIRAAPMCTSTLAELHPSDLRVVILQPTAPCSCLVEMSTFLMPSLLIWLRVHADTKCLAVALHVTIKCPQKSVYGLRIGEQRALFTAACCESPGRQSRIRNRAICLTPPPSSAFLEQLVTSPSRCTGRGRLKSALGPWAATSGREGPPQ